MNSKSKNKAVKASFFIIVAITLILLPFYSDIIKNFPLNFVLNIFSKETNTPTATDQNQPENPQSGSKLISLNDIAPENCKGGEHIMWDGRRWVCQKAIYTQVSKENTYTYLNTLKIENKLTEEDIENFIFDADNGGILLSGEVDLESIIVAGLLPNTNLNNDVTLLGNVIDINDETSGALDYARGGLGGPIPDPNGATDDAALFWDGSEQNMQWLIFGNNLTITDNTINAIDQYEGTVTSVGTGNGLTGGSITSSGTLSITSPTCLVSEKLLWNGSAFICSPDITNTGTVTSVGTGNGLTGGTITGAGTVAVNSPTCSGTDKLSWNGTSFVCGTDTDTTNPGTVTSVGSGNGLTGGAITGSGSLSVNSPTCLSTERLSWNGTAFVCVDTTYSAGNDLDLTGTTFDIESQLDNVTTISRSASSLTLQTVTSGDIVLNPAGGVGIGSATSGIKLNVVGTTRTTGFQLGTSSTDGYVLTTDADGVGSWEVLPVASVYQTTTSKTGTRIWNGTGVTTGSNGTVVVNVTNDGTGGGTALFNNIYSVQAIAQNNTTTANAVPLSSIRTISADRKTITLNVIVGNIISLLGVAGVQSAPNGLTTYVTVIGD